MYYLTTILILFTIRNLSFLYLSKYNIFFNGTFLYTLLLYTSIYVFNAQFFEDTELWDFENLKILKVEGALVPMCTKSLLRLCFLIPTATLTTDSLIHGGGQSWKHITMWLLALATVAATILPSLNYLPVVSMSSQRSWKLLQSFRQGCWDWVRKMDNGRLGHFYRSKRSDSDDISEL
jgi:hypothetical protein